MADTDCLFVDGDDEEPPAYVEFHSSILFILQMLDQACRNQHPAWCLSNAMESIANRAYGQHGAPLQLDEEDRDVLLRTLTRTKALMPVFMPDYSPEQFVVGINAAMTQVVMWSETTEQQALRHPHTKADARDLARALRNDMHTWCLAERVRERRHERRGAMIAEMLSLNIALGSV
ncbi:hypothetical protein FV232_13340 [Methylobacterium sp. WL30]|uniref:hypothetical protein n=1 Tax=unclassified Methylobacterium TaxID=2615210 RepID=UPI0011CAEE85|nr:MULTISPECIES: hypothetical protein [unclassified Methylobacterium]TXN41462.1 hypothetical protein FV225_02305 [Methylobacterium sp. WL93]TXN50558.1 hypothetical protein FV227_11420 [Methylobacterium sp. WL119]TXN67020.1 hypothetical protein FV232_13340 [Methylobacterium sp. WL30]